MKLEDILGEWTKDSTVDKTELDRESLNIPSLHQKYLKIYTGENLLLRKLAYDLKALELAKFEYYAGKMDQAELKTKGWDPWDKRILRQDIPRYLDGDKDLISLHLRLDYQKEKVEALKSILTSINGRSFYINNAVRFLTFLHGGN